MMKRTIGFLRNHRRFLILGHKDPDGDCVASQLVLASFLNRIGKETVCLSAGPFDRPEIAQFEGQFATDPVEGWDADAVVIVDCSTPDRTGAVGSHVQQLPACVVDHHASGEEFGDVRLIEPDVPATTLLVHRIIEAWGERPTEMEAQLLLLGFCTDTGFFRHLNQGSSEALKESARLLECGASPQQAYNQIYGGHELNRFRLLGRLLERTESHLGGRILLTWQSQEDSDLTGPGSRSSADLYQSLQMVAGSEIIVFVKQEDLHTCSVGLRSTSGYDVGALAKEFGGGGHRPAAGYSVQGSVEATREEILARLIRDITA